MMKSNEKKNLITEVKKVKKEKFSVFHDNEDMDDDGTICYYIT